MMQQRKQSSCDCVRPTRCLQDSFDENEIIFRVNARARQASLSRYDDRWWNCNVSTLLLLGQDMITGTCVVFPGLSKSWGRL